MMSLYYAQVNAWAFSIKKQPSALLFVKNVISSNIDMLIACLFLGILPLLVVAAGVPTNFGDRISFFR